MACSSVRVVGAFKTSIFSSSFGNLLRNSKFYNKQFLQYRACCSKTSESEYERDPAPLFFNPEIQSLLKGLTKVDLKKVFRRRKEGQRLEPPVYKLMTDADLQAAMTEANAKAEVRLQMPPVVKIRTEATKVLAEEPALQGYDEHKFAFTDISFGISNRQRLIVVREPNGTLRNATAEERHRYNQLYFPSPGRNMYTPKMFQQEYLEDLLDREEYEFILDRACVQFEPDDGDYHRVTQAVYTRVNKAKHFDHLRSTRHYGPLAFYLAWIKDIDELLLENIQTEKLDDAVLLIQLYHKINPTAKSATTEFDGDRLKFVQSYVEADANAKSILELAIQSYIYLENAREEIAQGIKSAHGVK